MDSKNQFKQLYTFTHITDFNSKLSIGSAIEVQGYSYIISAYLVYESRNNQWLEYQLYSTAHGYAKLIDKDHETIFFTKSHFLPDKNIWMMNQHESFISNKQRFKITEFQHAELYFAAGNLIETIPLGRRNKQCFAKSEDQFFHSVYSINEVKNYMGFRLQL
jgi:hypothetical protein